MDSKDKKRPVLSNEEFQKLKNEIILQQHANYAYVYVIFKDVYGIKSSAELREYFGDEVLDELSSFYNYDNFSSDQFFNFLSDDDKKFIRNNLDEIRTKYSTVTEFVDAGQTGDDFIENTMNHLEECMDEQRLNEIYNYISEADLSQISPELFLDCNFLENVRLENSGARLDMRNFEDGVRVNGSVKGCELLSYDLRAVVSYYFSPENYDKSQYMVLAEGYLTDESVGIPHEFYGILSDEKIQERFQWLFDKNIENGHYSGEKIRELYSIMSEKTKQNNMKFVDRGIECCIRDNDIRHVSFWAEYITPDIYDKYFSQIMELYRNNVKNKYDYKNNYAYVDEFVKKFFNDCSLDVQKKRIANLVSFTTGLKYYSGTWKSIDASVKEECLGVVVEKLFGEYYGTEDSNKRNDCYDAMFYFLYDSSIQARKKAADIVPFEKLVEECKLDDERKYYCTRYINLFWNYVTPEFKKKNVDLQQQLYEIVEQVTDEQLESCKALYAEKSDQKYIDEAISIISRLPVDFQGKYAEKVIELIKIAVNQKEGNEKDVNFDWDFEFISNIMNICGLDSKSLNEVIRNANIDKNMIFKYIFSEGDIELLDYRIKKVNEIFLTNDLPEVFKCFEFFRMHENHSQNNYTLYPMDMEIEERDRIILNDLFVDALESDNKQMRNLLDILCSGDKLFKKSINGYELTEEENAILLAYRDKLISLYDTFGNEKIEMNNDFFANIQSIKVKLQIDELNLGDTILKRFLGNLDFDFEKYCGGDTNVVSNLIDYMDMNREKAEKRNDVPLDVKNLLQEGDLVKGTSIVFLDSHMRLGIRSKEFYRNTDLLSDCTPFDTDFSELKEDNVKGKSGILSIINSTYSGTGYGNTLYVIKKEDYDKEKSYGRESTAGIESKDTRYIRTAIGCNSVSAIITSEWNDAYGYVMAQNGLYIPVVDMNTEEVVFTREQYNAIREKMRGLSFYGAENFEVAENALDVKVQAEANKIKSASKVEMTTEEKRKMVIKAIKKRIPQKVFLDMIGDLSEDAVELIDTGSTGRGTNIPGDGDFDFMLKCSDQEQQIKLIESIKRGLNGVANPGTNEYNIRYEGVKIEGISELVDIDVTSERKSLDVEFSSDMCVRERLDNIRRNYGEDVCNQIINNIIVAKKRLKSIGAYKKENSRGATEFGGFGGIGVENWILQNGGSFITAMQTFLDNTIDDNGQNISFEEFKKVYPIYDFGQNHRSNSCNGGHDHYVEGLTEAGFKAMKEQFRTILKEYGIEYIRNSQSKMISVPVKEDNQEDNENNKLNFWESITAYTKSAKDYLLSDMSRIYGYIAKYRGTREQQEYALEI